MLITWIFLLKWGSEITRIRKCSMIHFVYSVHGLASIGQCHTASLPIVSPEKTAKRSWNRWKRFVRYRPPPDSQRRACRWYPAEVARPVLLSRLFCEDRDATWAACFMITLKIRTWISPELIFRKCMILCQWQTGKTNTPPPRFTKCQHFVRDEE